MRIRSVRRTVALAALVACALAPLSARAAVPEPERQPAKPAAVDTSRFLPRWVHLHAAIGVGWLASPPAIRQLYQAGQGYELGFEARPSSAWRLRLNGEYQTLPVVIDHDFRFVTQTGIDGQVVVDTLRLEGTGQGWLGSGRLEAQRALIPGVWAIAGFGGGYLTSGLNSVNVLGQEFSFERVLPGVSGWVVMPSIGGVAESDVLGPMLGIEVRWTQIIMPQRTGEHLQQWSVRIGWTGF
jgi:hypothetical protein